MAKTFGSEIISGIGSLTNRIKSLTETGNGVNKLTVSFKSLLGALIGIRGITGVFNWMKSAVTEGANVAEINHIVESTFKNLSSYVDVWATDAMDNYGLAANAAKRYAGTLSAMFQASEIGYKDAAKMSTDLVGLAADLSSYFNIDQETAYEKIKSGMAGMVRPLRDLGIDLTAATLKEYALSQGITKSYTSMTQAEKIMLRYQYLMHVTTNQQGDFQKTSMSLANSLRILKSYASAVTAALGEGFAAALRHVVHLLNAMMKYVLKAAQAFATFMNTIFGKNISGGGVVIDTSAFEEADDYAADLDDSASSAADGLDDAANNAKKLVKNLSVLDFDELHQLNKDTDTSSKTSKSGSGSGSGPDISGIGDGLLDMAVDAFDNNKLPDAISRWAERIKKAFDAQDWVGLGKAIAWGINKGIDYLYDVLDPAKVKKKVKPFIDAFTTVFNSLVDSIKWNKLGKTLARGINDLLYIANSTMEGINWKNLGKKLAEGMNGLVSELDWNSLGKFFANKLNTLWQTAYGFVTKFDWTNLGRNLARGAIGLVYNIDYDSIVGTITEGLKGIADAVYTFAVTFPWADYGRKLALHANDLIENLPTEELGEAIGTLVTNIASGLNSFAENFSWWELGRKLGKGINALNRAINWTKVSKALTTSLNGAFDTLKAFALETDWQGLVDNITSGINTFIDEFEWKENGASINTFLTNFVGAACDIIKGIDFKGLGSGIAQMLQEVEWADLLWEAATTMMNALGDLLSGLGETPAGKIVEAVTLAIVGIKLAG